MAIVKSSVPEAVTWQELLEETHSDTELQAEQFMRVLKKLYQIS